VSLPERHYNRVNYEGGLSHGVAKAFEWAMKEGESRFS